MDDIKSVKSLKDEAVKIIWCPGCDKMVSNEYNRCPQCKTVINEEWLAEYEVVQKVEKELDELLEAGNYEKALIRAEVLKDIGRKVDDSFLIEEQEALINQLSLELEGAEDLEKVIENARKLDLIFDKFMQLGRAAEAHELVEEFKRVHHDQLDKVKSFPIIAELFKKSDKAISHVENMQKYIVDKLDALKTQIKLQVNRRNLISADEKWKEAEELLKKVSDPQIRAMWESFKSEYMNQKIAVKKQLSLEQKLKQLENEVKTALNEGNFYEADAKWDTIKILLPEIIDPTSKLKYEQVGVMISEKRKLIDKRDGLFNEIPKLRMEIIKAMNAGEFKSADKKWMKAIKLLKNVQNEKVREKWFNFKDIYDQKKEEYKIERKDAKKKHKELLREISESEEIFKDSIAQYLLYGARFYAKRLSKLAEELGDKILIEKYKNQLKQVSQEVAEREVETEFEVDQLKEFAEGLDTLIEVEEDILPLVAEIPAEEILSVDEHKDKPMISLINLLEKYRVDIKKELVSHQLLQSKSEEFIEHEQSILIEEDSEEHIPLTLTVDSFMLNPFEGELDEAIIVDLIPYNYEILAVSINGMEITKSINKKLTQHGLEIKWVLKNVPLGSKVIISYQLRKRLSRTIIFIHEDILKIAKTHSSLKKTEGEGDALIARVPCKNPYEEPIERIIIEDILPYQHHDSMIEPTDLTPMVISYPQVGEVIRWSIPNMKTKQRSFIYKLKGN